MRLTEKKKQTKQGDQSQDKTAKCKEKMEETQEIKFQNYQ